MSSGSDSAVFTVGYGPRSVSQLVEHLRLHRVGFLIDVRSRPYSRYKPEFSKEPLQGAVRAAGLSYLFLGDSIGGMPDDERWYRDGQLDRDAYRRSDGFVAGLQRVIDGHRQGFRLCLMCAEQDPRGCHRSYLIAAALGEHGIEVMHIDGDGELLRHSDLDRGTQLGLFS